MGLHKPTLPDLNYVNMSHPETTPRAVDKSDPMSIISPESTVSKPKPPAAPTQQKAKVDEDDGAVSITVKPKLTGGVELPTSEVKLPVKPDAVVPQGRSTSFIEVDADGTLRQTKPDPDESFVQSVISVNKKAEVVAMQSVDDEIGSHVDVRMVCSALSCLAGAMSKPDVAQMCVDILRPICEKLKEKSQCHAECSGQQLSQCVDVTVEKDEKAKRTAKAFHAVVEEKALIQMGETEGSQELGTSEMIQEALDKEIERERIRDLEDKHSYELLKQLRSQE